MIATVIAWILAVLWIINIIGGPFLIGKEKTNKTWTAGGYVSDLFMGGTTIYLCGKVLGWW